MAVDARGLQVAKRFDDFVYHTEPSQDIVDGEAVIDALQWAHEEEVTDIIVRTENQLVIDLIMGQHAHGKRLEPIVQQAQEELEGLNARIITIRPEENQAAHAAMKEAEQQRQDAEEEEVQATVSIVERWIAEWPDVKDALEEMFDVITEQGMHRERPWLNGNAPVQIELSLKELEAIIRAYEDCEPEYSASERDEDDDWDEGDDDDLTR